MGGPNATAQIRAAQIRADKVYQIVGKCYLIATQLNIIFSGLASEFPLTDTEIKEIQSTYDIFAKSGVALSLAAAAEYPDGLFVFQS